jgi:hypothetical protein
LIALAALGALTAFALPRTGGAANPKLIGTVGPGYTISLTDANGVAVTSLPAGTYDIEVHDESAIHNFHLYGPTDDQKTEIDSTGTVTWTVALTPGTWTYVCDLHGTMTGSFTVTSGTTSSSTSTETGTTSTGTTSTGTTSTGTTSTTSPPTTTTAPIVPAPVRCIVPAVVAKPLATARRRIVRAHCRTGRIRLVYSTRIRARRVIAQRPRAGTRLAAGARVALVVSRGPRARR